MNIDFAFGIAGIAGAFLCIIGDILLDYKGSDNKQIGPMGIIDSNWLKMSEWRFRVSIILAFIGVPLYALTFFAMSHQLSLVNETMAWIFFLASVVGLTGGFFIHTLLCLYPITAKVLAEKGANDDLRDTLFMRMNRSIIVPFIIQYVGLVVITSVVLIFAILTGLLNLHWIFVILNPLVLMMIGIGLRVANSCIFADLPGIIMPSLGIAMIGMMTVLLATG